MDPGDVTGATPDLVDLSNSLLDTAGAPVGMWTWGHVHTKFWHLP